MGDSIPVSVTWDLQVTTHAEVPEDVWEKGKEKIQEYMMEACNTASATKTRVAGTFIVGEVHGELKKTIGEIAET